MRVARDAARLNGCRSGHAGERGEDVVAVALELRRADARDARELGERARLAFGDLRERRVVEDDVRRDFVGLGAFEAPLA